MFKHLLIPTDGSEQSELAVKGGITLARSLGARVTVLASSPAFRVLATEPEMLSETREEYERRVRAMSRRCLLSAEEMARALSVECETDHWLSASPHRAIIAVAKVRACDAIVMPSLRRSGTAATLGGETSRVLAESEVPVLVWP